MILLCDRGSSFVALDGVTSISTPQSIAINSFIKGNFVNVYIDSQDPNKLHYDLVHAYITSPDSAVIVTDIPSYIMITDERIKPGFVYNVSVPYTSIQGSQDICNYISDSVTYSTKFNYLEACLGHGLYRLQLYRKISDNELVIRFESPTFFSGLSFIDYTMDLRSWAIENDEQYKVDNMSLYRTGLLKQLDPNDSFSYTDIQVDVLSKILFDIIEANPEMKAIALESVKQYTNFKDIALENSVFKRRTEEQMLEKFKKSKEHVHNTLVDWYSKKDAKNSK